MSLVELETLKHKLQLLESENQRLRRQALPDDKVMKTENEVTIVLRSNTPVNGGGNAAPPPPPPPNPMGVAAMAAALAGYRNPVPTVSPVYHGISKTIQVIGGIEVTINAKKETIENTRNDEGRPSTSAMNSMLFDDYTGDSRNRKQLSIWCEVKSMSTTEECNILLIVKSSSKANVDEQFDFCFVDYLQLCSFPCHTPTRSCREIKENKNRSPDMYMSHYTQYTLAHGPNPVMIPSPNQPDSCNLSLTLKVVRIPTKLEEMPVNDSTVTVVIENQKIEVDAGYVSRWSAFLQAYFASNMKEKAEGIYPINICNSYDFRELLQVIYPSAKPIDTGNVRRMLEIAGKFIMPELTRKCEIFLCSTVSIDAIDLLGIADKYDLYFSKMAVLERIISTEQLRTEIINNPSYMSLTNDMKRSVDARYVQLDLQDSRKKSRTGSY